MIPFGEWLPDQPTGNTGTVVQAVNVIPTAAGYRSMPIPAVVSTVAMSETCYGAFVGTYASGGSNVRTLFTGGETKLFQLQSGTLTDVSKVGGYTVDPSREAWDFTQYRDEVIATASAASGQTPQRWTLGSSSAFADLGGSPPPARFCATVGDFLVLGYTYDSAAQPHNVAWCALGDITSWAESAATQAGSQNLSSDGGPIMRLVGGRVGWIFQRNAIVRMEYVGPPVLFSFQVVHRNTGLWQSRAIRKVGNTIYFLSQSGYYAMDAETGALTGIGAQKVDQWRLAQAGSGYASCAYYARLGVVAWMIDQAKVLLLYHPATGKWSTYDADTHAGGTSNINWLVEGLNDSGQYLGYVAQDKHYYEWPQGLWSAWTTAKCLIETAEGQITPGRRSMLSRARILQTLGTAGTETLSTKTRNSQTESLTTTALTAASRGEDFVGRVDARYHAFVMTSTAKDTEYQGIDIVSATPTGKV